MDPNDPRYGNILRLSGLLATIGPDHNDKPKAAARRAALGITGRRVPDGRKAATVDTEEEEEEDNDFFRAPQEQQVLVFAGRRQVARDGGITRRGGISVGGGFQSFAYNNYRW